MIRCPPGKRVDELQQPFFTHRRLHRPRIAHYYCRPARCMPMALLAERKDHADLLDKAIIVDHLRVGTQSSQQCRVELGSIDLDLLQLLPSAAVNKMDAFAGNCRSDIVRDGCRSPCIPQDPGEPVNERRRRTSGKCRGSAANSCWRSVLRRSSRTKYCLRRQWLQAHRLAAISAPITSPRYAAKLEHYRARSAACIALPHHLLENRDTASGLQLGTSPVEYDF